MREFLKMVRTYVLPYKKYLGWAVVLNILSAVFNVFSFTVIIPMLKILFNIDNEVHQFIPWDTAGVSIKDKVVENAYYYVSLYDPINVMLVLCAFLAFMTLMKTSCYFGSSAVMIPIKTGITRDLRRRIYNKILSLPIGFFSQERKGDIIARMSGDVSEVEHSISSSIDMLIKNPILIVIYATALIFLSWQLTLVTIVFTPLMGWIMGVIGRQLKKKSLQAQALWSDTMSQVEETLGGLRIVKAFRAEKKMSDRFGGITESMRKKYTRVGVRQTLAHPVSEFLGTVMILVVVIFGGYLIIESQRAGSTAGARFLGATLDAPTFIYYLLILYSILNPIKEFSKATYSIPKGMASMDRINKILDAENPIQDPASPKPLRFEKSITFEHVSFNYETDRRILDDISLEIGKGRNIAIVGESGAGKSTLVDLIPRFFDVTEGRIAIDGTDIREVRLSELRGLMGNVNQEPILFNDTIFNNIAFGVENATEEEVIAAAKIANAHEFIMEKEEGYQTNIGDRGVKLSGGQRQRLSIARAILKNPPILILDEATASLDTQSERLVQEALDRLMSSRTTISIAHRLSTVKNADEIIVMHEGRIVERGRHDELIALGGYYKHLHDMQSI